MTTNGCGIMQHYFSLRARKTPTTASTLWPATIVAGLVVAALVGVLLDLG